MRTEDEMLNEIENADEGRGPDPLMTLEGDALQAVLAAVKARATAQEAIDAAVQQARDEGASWTVIGSILGVSRQAARQRYSAA